MRTATRTANTVFTMTLCSLLGACLDHPVEEVRYDKTVVPSTMLPIDLNRDVDILFVIDNSGSMAEEQARLARNFPTFIASLDEMGADYRIGITTTDVKHPGCTTAATPEDGALVLRSCTEAVAEGAFEFNGLDAAYACTDQCKLGADQLRVTESADGEVHPWLESISGVQNLPEGVAMADAFACFGPQGINGCGYESPLEAMRLAISKARADKGTGFMRDEALLSVVLVTDEADCSSNPAHANIFTTNPTFQNDSDPKRTSAICWRAGVACTGEGPEFKECHAEDYSADGTPGVTDAGDAVLHPIDRYVEFLAGLRAGGGAPVDDGGPLAREVLVSLIAGVPVGYDQGTAEIEYSAAEPGSTQDINFGVAPGCTNTEDGSNSTAVPPVREREVAEAFAGSDGARNVFSICQDDYSPALEQIAAAVRRALPPACAGACIEDSNLETKVLEPVCSVSASFADGSSEQVPACVVDGDGWAVPAGASVCFAMLVDPDGRTPFKGDDMTRVVDAGGESVPACSTDRENVEFKLLRAGPRRAGVTYEAACVAADDNTACAAD
jgi:hypothetical protein